jgi:hypothetical protein
MHRRIDLSPAKRVEHAEIIRRWRWFRSQLVALHGFGSLPDSFGEDDGEIKVSERVNEDDPLFDLAAPEWNYNARTQVLRFDEGPHHVEIRVCQTDYGDHFSFDHAQAGAPQEKAHLLGTFRECYLDIDDASPHASAWERATP